MGLCSPEARCGRGWVGYKGKKMAGERRMSRGWSPCTIKTLTLTHVVLPSCLAFTTSPGPSCHHNNKFKLSHVSQVIPPKLQACSTSQRRTPAANIEMRTVDEPVQWLRHLRSAVCCNVFLLSSFIADPSFAQPGMAVYIDKL